MVRRDIGRRRFEGQRLCFEQVLLVAAFVVGGCAGRSASEQHVSAGDAGSTGAGSAGSSGASSGSAGSAASSGGAGSGGAGSGGAGSGGASLGGASGAGAGGGGTAGGSAGDATEGGYAGEPTAVGGATSIAAVVKSAGCGKNFLGTSGQAESVQTMGVKAPDCADMRAGAPACGTWSTPRQYYLYLPPNYDLTKPYSLVFEGPGCGGRGADITLRNNAQLDAIVIGLSPGPNSLGHATNENQGCFDDREGDDSIDWVFYENLYDHLNDSLCFDRQRVFIAGNYSGSRMANELACKYAGDSVRPVRGVLSHGAGLPAEPKYAPTCSNASVAGMWVHRVQDLDNPYAETAAAITRAMSHNHCTEADSFATATLQNYPIGGGQPDDTCKLVRNCDPLYPLVICALPGSPGRSGDLNVVNPGFTTFLGSFRSPPLIEP